MLTIFICDSITKHWYAGSVLRQRGSVSMLTHKPALFLLHEARMGAATGSIGWVHSWPPWQKSESCPGIFKTGSEKRNLYRPTGSRGGMVTAVVLPTRSKSV